MPVLQANKRLFSVDSKEDLKIFSQYLKNSTWGKDGCPFMEEKPWRSVPDMIKDKIARKYLGVA